MVMLVVQFRFSLDWSQEVRQESCIILINNVTQNYLYSLVMFCTIDFNKSLLVAIQRNTVHRPYTIRFTSNLITSFNLFCYVILQTKVCRDTAVVFNLSLLITFLHMRTQFPRHRAITTGEKHIKCKLPCTIIAIKQLIARTVAYSTLADDI